jgi:DNA-binding response OmpR family regulator
MAKKTGVIIVEDHADLRDSMVAYLGNGDFHACGVGSGLEFYRILTEKVFDIAVIDVELPDQSGYVLAEYARQNTPMGIIILTARGGMEDRLRGYDSGVDLYMVKPVDCRELTAAIRNLAARLVDRLPTPRQAAFSLKSWQLVKNSWQLVSPAGNPIRLTAKEMLFMASLAETPGKPVRRDTLLELLDYQDNEYARRAMDALVRRLRRKIEAESAPAPVKTIHAFGYCFSAAITIV